jgi:hypothetical protein
LEETVVGDDPELRDSRAIAVNLKDADSVKWLDKQILEPESQKRQRNETQDDQRLLTKR